MPEADSGLPRSMSLVEGRSSGTFSELPYTITIVRVLPLESSVIRFAGLTKRYGSIVAVRELTIEARPGEAYALLGPNGAGKTSALRCLAGLIRPSAGTASVDDIDVIEDPIGVRRKIGFVAASMGLYERLSARELVEYFGRLHGLEDSLLKDRVNGVIDLFGIGPFENRFCGRLSTGQRQRVSLARAVVHDPPALILDEPTLGLDILSGQTIYDFILSETGKGKTVLFSTHQMDEVELLADRVGVLSEGRLVAEGKPTELVSQTGEENLTRAFLSLVTPKQVRSGDDV
jgi:sodium transport system ATP-binding protein